MENEIPPHERKYREATAEQISDIPPHRLRALVRSLQHEMRTRRLPTITLLLIRKIAEQNLLSTPAGSEEEHEIRKQEAADISNVELLTTSLSRGTPCRTNTHMQLIHDFDRGRKSKYA
jgi:hypothetical protein